MTLQKWNSSPSLHLWKPAHVFPLDGLLQKWTTTWSKGRKNSRQKAKKKNTTKRKNKLSSLSHSLTLHCANLKSIQNHHWHPPLVHAPEPTCNATPLHPQLHWTYQISRRRHKRRTKNRVPKNPLTAPIRPPFQNHARTSIIQPLTLKGNQPEFSPTPHHHQPSIALQRWVEPFTATQRSTKRSPPAKSSRQSLWPKEPNQPTPANLHDTPLGQLMRLLCASTASQLSPSTPQAKSKAPNRKGLLRLSQAGATLVEVPHVHVSDRDPLVGKSVPTCRTRRCLGVALISVVRRHRGTFRRGIKELKKKGRKGGWARRSGSAKKEKVKRRETSPVQWPRAASAQQEIEKEIKKRKKKEKRKKKWKKKATYILFCLFFFCLFDLLFVLVVFLYF